MGVTREFETKPIGAQDLVKRITARCGAAWAAGKTVVWSFKPLPADVQSGAWRPHVLALARYLVDNNLQDCTVIVIWHEPENDIGKFFTTPATFVRLFNKVHGWLKSVDPTILTSHAALGYAYRDGGMTDQEATEWVTEASIHSIDLYSGRSFPLTMTLGTSTAWRRWKATRPPGARWAVSERGWIADSSESLVRASAIDDECAWLAGLAPDALPDFYLVFNSPGTEDDALIVLDAAGQAAVNRLFAALTPFAALPPAEPPSLPPTPVRCPLCAGDGTVPSGTYTQVLDAVVFAVNRESAS
jgi:hypothetical protein